MSQEKRQEFYGRAEGVNLSPLWEVLATIAPPKPTTAAAPALWRYSDVRPFLFEASSLITAEEAERRVMILENPGLNKANRITDSLYAGLQLVMPGEVAPSHRHTANALRFIVEGNGAHTTVDGEKTIVHPGDFVITPGWTWHEHANDSEEPVVWIDGLDIHIVNFLNSGFFEPHSPNMQLEELPEGYSYRAYGHNLRPIGHEPVRVGNSPIFNYPYRISRDILHSMQRDGAPDKCHGFKMKYINPDNGDWAIPSIAACIQLLPAGFSTEPYRSTDGTVFSVVEGRGHSLIGSQRFDWSEKDIFVVPNWVEVRHFSDSDAVLFSYSDRAVQEKLGLWREVRGV